MDNQIQQMGEELQQDTIPITSLDLASTTAVDFEHYLDQGKRKAELLKQLVQQANLTVNITNKKTGQSRPYLQVEAWQALGSAYGIIASIPQTPGVVVLEDGGYAAYAELTHVETGRVIGGAWSECGSAGDGDWPNRPVFSQKSMAQTRAIAKAFRCSLSWIVVLAGFSPTPAEEMPDEPNGHSNGNGKRSPKVAVKAEFAQTVERDTNPNAPYRTMRDWIAFIDDLEAEEDLYPCPIHQGVSWKYFEEKNFWGHSTEDPTFKQAKNGVRYCNLDPKTLGMALSMIAMELNWSDEFKNQFLLDNAGDTDLWNLKNKQSLMFGFLQMLAVEYRQSTVKDA